MKSVAKSVAAGLGLAALVCGFGAQAASHREAPMRLAAHRAMAEHDIAKRTPELETDRAAKTATGAAERGARVR